nr:MAG TPA: hypothetical protein [Caudoviricetes sp.]
MYCLNAYLPKDPLSYGSLAARAMPPLSNISRTPL